ncbi:GlxA family transcriptional regulator [Nocardioides sp.]|uniref:GlxA family transcriptional regulator n=1 Tax=Nocardioides sp. TaxID=35761 RepID=UPI003782EA65
MEQDSLRIGALAYPGCFASEVFGVVDLLTMARHVTQTHEPGRDPFSTMVLSPRRRVVASGGVSIGVAAVRPVDVLVVPGFDLDPTEDLGDRLDRLGPEVELLRTHAEAGTAIVSLCVGAFLLGASGLLDHREATTSWLFADALARRHPQARVVPDRLVVTDRGVTTTAAFSAMFDFVIGLVERHCGRTVARRTARIALVDDSRTSQAPYVDEALLPVPGSSFARQVQRLLDQQLAEPYDLAALAGHLHVSPRTLLRRYRAETGEAPLPYLQRRRVQRARRLLETSDRTVTDIRHAVGYRDPGAFADLFSRHVGLGPAAYRARFRSAPD